jgi:hypothetical protein
MSKTQVERYPGIWVEAVVDPLALEMELIRNGGRWKSKRLGKMVGMGLEYHWKAALLLAWPEVKWHRWLDLLLEKWLAHRYVGILGSKDSGKSLFASIAHLMDYYLYPSETTILICSTTREDLENRIWGEMKKLHRSATRRYRWLSGHLIEGKQRIVTDDRSEAAEGRDFRNGIMGVPCKKGTSYVGISSFVGLKNKRLRLCGDELSLLPKAFIDSTANLMGGGDRKVTGMGNPADMIDALGLLCEPAASLGGWDGGIDQTPKTKTWETRWPNGVCIQLCGSDSPNMDEPAVAVELRGESLFPFLISRKTMEDDAKIWGTDDWHYTMFNEARMPRGQGSRRVITRQMCSKFHAMDEPIWLNSDRTYIAFLDAAYRGVGGDRCVYGVLCFGAEAKPLNPGEVLTSAIIDQSKPDPSRNIILALLHTAIIPIQGGAAGGVEPPEDQIVRYVMSDCALRNIPPENFFFDSGMRTSLVTAFGRVWSPKVMSIDFGGKPSDGNVSANINVANKDYYYNFVSEMWFTVRHIIETGQFRGMTEEMAIEGSSREWKIVGANKIQIETKPDYKLKTGRSPDLFDALVCGCRGAIIRGFVIKSLNNPKVVRVDQTWKTELRKKARDLREAAALDHAA